MWKRISEFIFGEPLQGALPERVKLAIDAHQDNSEKLIGWVQLLLGMIFSILYSLSPSTSPEAGFQPVPWALAFYISFTIIRLLASHKTALPRWFLTVSVIVDIGLLMSLIWSFHIQYMQPPSFYLKAPTMIYVFIFISLRALRFQPGYIILAGSAAAIGWGLMVLYVIVSVPGDPMITKNYVAYLTSNAILIGAEVDKIITILLVTAVLAIAVLRAERVFQKAVLESIAAADLSRFVSPEVADRIISADRAIEPGDGEAKTASVIFTDIEGFSTFSEKLSPSELGHLMNEYFDAMSEAIDKFGGVITQYQGDAMLITFNAVTDDPDHAANAIKTALDIQHISQVHEYCHGEKLKTRIGINTGEVIVGAVGAKDRLQFTVHGDDVNIAARLEQLNKQYGTYILASEQTTKACVDPHPWQRQGEVVVRGREKPTTVYSLEN